MFPKRAFLVALALMPTAGAATIARLAIAAMATDKKDQQGFAWKRVGVRRDWQGSFEGWERRRRGLGRGALHSEMRRADAASPYP